MKVSTGLSKPFPRRVPGKEIWVTEFNPRGGRPGSPGDPERSRRLADAGHRARAALPVAPSASYRSAVFHADFDQGMSFRFSLNPGTVISRCQWPKPFPGSSMPRTGARRTGIRIGQQDSWRGAVPDAFFCGGSRLVRRPQGRTLLVQNATEQVASLDLAPFGEGPPSHVDILATPNLGAARSFPPTLCRSRPPEKITLPPFSLTRVLWAR